MNPTTPQPQCLRCGESKHEGRCSVFVERMKCPRCGLECRIVHRRPVQCAQALKVRYDRLKNAVDTIPAALMLAGGPPYTLKFTEACLKEILESQR